MTKPTNEQVARIKKIWAETPLCESAWCRGEEWLNEDTGMYEYKVTEMCPIAALLNAAGISPEEVRELVVYANTDDVYYRYEGILKDQYGIDFKMFDSIISTVDNLPIEYSNNEGIRNAASAALENPLSW